MSGEVVVHRNRTTKVLLNLGFDVSGDTITSQIREEADVSSNLLATWTVSFDTDGTDGKLTLTLSSSDVATVTKKYGYMDLKRVSGGEPLPVFKEPIKVKFQGVVTS